VSSLLSSNSSAQAYSAVSTQVGGKHATTAAAGDRNARRVLNQHFFRAGPTNRPVLTNVIPKALGAPDPTTEGTVSVSRVAACHGISHRTFFPMPMLPVCVRPRRLDLFGRVSSDNAKLINSMPGDNGRAPCRLSRKAAAGWRAQHKCAAPTPPTGRDARGAGIEKRSERKPRGTPGDIWIRIRRTQLVAWCLRSSRPCSARPRTHRDSGLFHPRHFRPTKRLPALP